VERLRCDVFDHPPQLAMRLLSADASRETLEVREEGGEGGRRELSGRLRRGSDAPCL
jgi:hypothetical protein